MCQNAAMRDLTLTLVLLCAANEAAAQTRQTQASVYVTAIEVVADVRDRTDKVPPGLTPSDFVLLEEGVERRIIAVDYLRAETPAPPVQTSPPAPVATNFVGRSAGDEWQFVAYFETLLSSGKSRQRAAEAILQRVDSLVARGRVDVVLAAPNPTALVRNSRDPEAIRRALKAVAAHPGTNQLTDHRREYYRESQALAGLEAVRDASREEFVESGRTAQRQSAGSSFADAPATFETAVVRPYVDGEIQLVSHFRTGLLTWLSSYRRHTPRILLMVIDGFDTNPLDYYLSSLPKREQITLRSSISSTGLGELTQQLADALAAGSWITVSIPTDDRGGWVDDASSTGMGRFHGLTRRAMNPKGVLFSPIEPLSEIALATGGTVAKGNRGLSDVFDSLDDRLRITYQVSRRPDGKPRKIELRARDKSLMVRAARWASSSTPEEIAETRALRLLRETTFGGDLPVQSSVEWAAMAERRNGTLRATASLELLANVVPPGARGEFRFTLAVLMLPNRVTVVNRLVTDYDLSGGTFRIRTPIDVPAEVSRMVVVIEETATGLWGSSRLDIR